MRFILILMASLFGPGLAHAADIAGSSDYPLIPRYEGSDIVKYEHLEFSDYRLMVEAATAYGGVENNLDATLPLEGEVTRITYRAPAERSVLEVFRNYEAALKEAGFEPVYSCEKEACGGRNFNHILAAGDLYMVLGEMQAEQRYLAAKLSRPEGDVYAAVYVVKNNSGGGPNMGRTMVQLDVVEMEPMEEKMVVLDSGALKSGLATEGRIAVYGILFDFDKAVIRPDSKPQLEEIAAFLKQVSDLEVLIVGHTDSKGALDYNRELSERRAKAVVAALSGTYGIDPGRLTAVGLGMAAPVASNRTEEGRAQNRRVEIVER